MQELEEEMMIRKYSYGVVIWGNLVWSGLKKADQNRLTRFIWPDLVWSEKIWLGSGSRIFLRSGLVWISNLVFWVVFFCFCSSVFSSRILFFYLLSENLFFCVLFANFVLLRSLREFIFLRVFLGFELV